MFGQRQGKILRFMLKDTGIEGEIVEDIIIKKIFEDVFKVKVNNNDFREVGEEYNYSLNQLFDLLNRKRSIDLFERYEESRIKDDNIVPGTYMILLKDCEGIDKFVWKGRFDNIEIPYGILRDIRDVVLSTAYGQTPGLCLEKYNFCLRDYNNLNEIIMSLDDRCNYFWINISEEELGTLNASSRINCFIKNEKGARQRDLKAFEEAREGDLALLYNDEYNKEVFAVAEIMEEKHDSYRKETKQSEPCIAAKVIQQIDPAVKLEDILAIQTLYGLNALDKNKRVKRGLIYKLAKADIENILSISTLKRKFQHDIYASANRCRINSNYIFEGKTLYKSLEPFVKGSLMPNNEVDSVKALMEWKSVNREYALSVKDSRGTIIPVENIGNLYEARLKGYSQSYAINLIYEYEEKYNRYYEENCGRTLDSASLYAPWHYYGDRYGIYVNMQKLWLLIIDIIKNTHLSYSEARKFALDMVLTHNKFHHIVEIYAANLEVLKNQYDIYYSYYDRIYDKYSKSKIHTEELLADHYIKIEFPEIGGSRLTYLEEMQLRQRESLRLGVSINDENQLEYFKKLEDEINVTTSNRGYSSILHTIAPLAACKLTINDKLNIPLYIVADMEDREEFRELVKNVFPNVLGYEEYKKIFPEDSLKY